MEPDKMERPTCVCCGSPIVLRDAFANWDVDSQQWVLHSVYDFYYCEACDETTEVINWSTLPIES